MIKKLKQTQSQTKNTNSEIARQTLTKLTTSTSNSLIFVWNEELKMIQVVIYFYNQTESTQTLKHQELHKINN